MTKYERAKQGEGSWNDVRFSSLYLEEEDSVILGGLSFHSNRIEKALQVVIIDPLLTTGKGLKRKKISWLSQCQGEVRSGDSNIGLFHFDFEAKYKPWCNF